MKAELQTALQNIGVILQKQSRYSSMEEAFQIKADFEKILKAFEEPEAKPVKEIKDSEVIKP